MAGSFLLSRLIRRRTRGLEPAAIAALADHREALLHSSARASSPSADDGTVTVLSDSARELIGLDGDVEGRRVDELDLDPAVVDLLSDDAAIRDHVVVVGERVLVVNRNPVVQRREPRRVGDHAARPHRAARAAERAQRDASRSRTPCARRPTSSPTSCTPSPASCSSASTTRCRGFVGTLSRRRRADLRRGDRPHVEDPTVAALLIAKTSLAVERGVDLGIAADSGLPRLDPDALQPTSATVLGNLVDNAVDASVSVGGTSVEVDVEPRRRRRPRRGGRHRARRPAGRGGQDLPPGLSLQGGRARGTGCRTGARAGRLRARRRLRRSGAGEDGTARVFTVRLPGVEVGVSGDG